MGASHLDGLYLQQVSPLHGIAGHVKVVAAASFVTSVALTPRRSLWIFAVAGVFLLLGLVLSGISFSQVAKRSRVLAAFLPLALLLPFVAGGERTSIAGVVISSPGLWGSWNFLVKAFLGLAVSLILTSTTTIPDILAALAKLRAPRVMVAIAGSMVRYLDVIVGETSRTRHAMSARGYAPTWFWQLRPMAYSAGTLFVRSYERSERVHAAMLARGFNGTMPARPLKATPVQWLLVCWPSAVMACLVIAAAIG